jgi:hypothetical protein
MTAACAHPYRVAVRPGATSRTTPLEPLESAQRVAGFAILGWALLRLGVCTMRGLDFEGFVGLVIVVSRIAGFVERRRAE